MKLSNSKVIKLSTMVVAMLGLSACSNNDNNPPQATSASLVTQTETDIVSNLPASDKDNDPLTFSVIVEPTSGTLTVNADGSFTYSPFPEVTGSDSFVYGVTDNRPSGASPVEGTISIQINPLVLSFLDESLRAFGQDANDDPIAINGRVFTQDVTGVSDYQGLIDVN